MLLKELQELLVHEPIIRNNPSLLKKLVFPYAIFLVSIIILTIGFTSIIELIHSLKSSKDSFKIYWLNINNNNIFIWIIFSLIFIGGILLTKKCFRLVKEKWNDVIDEVKLGLIK